MLDIEYSVITSDVIKSFDCRIKNLTALNCYTRVMILGGCPNTLSVCFQHTFLSFILNSHNG